MRMYAVQMHERGRNEKDMRGMVSAGYARFHAEELFRNVHVCGSRL